MKYTYTDQTEYEVCKAMAKKYKISQNPKTVADFIKNHSETKLIMDKRCPSKGQGRWILGKFCYNNSVWNSTNFLEYSNE